APRHGTGTTRQAGRDTGGHVAEPGGCVPPEVGTLSGWKAFGVGCSREQEVQPAVVVIIAPRHGTLINSLQAGRDAGRHVAEPAAGVPPQLDNPRSIEQE